MGFLIALVSGALMSVQGVFNTAVSKVTGMWVMNSFVQITAFMVCIAGWFVTGRASFGNLLKVSPKYLLLGGIIGAFITLTVVKSLAQLGPAKSVMVIVVSQITVSYLIELFGLFGVERVGFELKKLIGVILAIGGILLFKS